MATYVTFHQGHTECSVKCAQGKLAYMSLVMRKLAFCICENKDTDQLGGNREADQRLCFRYTPIFFLVLGGLKIWTALMISLFRKGPRPGNV